MATAPVTLDLSKSEPISQGVTLDLSKSQPINDGKEAAEGTAQRTLEGIGRSLYNMVTGIPQAAYQSGKSAAQFSQDHPILRNIPGLSEAAGLYDTLYAKPTEQAVQHLEKAGIAHGTTGAPLFQNAPNGPTALTAGKVLAHIPLVGPMALNLGERGAGDPQAGVQPDVAGALGEIGTYAVAPELAARGGSAALNAVRQYGAEKAPLLYRSALKPSTTIPAAKAGQMIDTAIQHEIPVGASGIEKLGALVDDLNEKIKAVVDSDPNRPINKFSVTSRLSQTAQKFGNQVNPEADIAAIGESGNEFLRNQPGPIPAEQAQAIKQGTYQQLSSKAYGELKSASIESQKALARGLREEIATAFPELNGLNAEEGQLLSLQPVLERAVNRISNHQLMGIGTPLAGAGVKAATGSTGAAAAAGVFKAIFDLPEVKSRLAFKLAKAGMGKSAIDARIGQLSSALAASANEQPAAGQNSEQPTQ